MRVKFNTFDTHEDINNIIDIEGVNFRKLSYTDNNMVVRINMLNPLIIIGNSGDTGILLIEDDENNIVLFNKNVVLSQLFIQNVKEVGLSFTRYSYEFSILEM